MTKYIKTEHVGAKNGGGHFGKREEAKRLSKRRRRECNKEVIHAELVKPASVEK